MIQPNHRKPYWTELLVTSVLAVQFITYLFSIFGNPIKAGFELGRKVENMSTQFSQHCIADTAFHYLVLTKFAENSSDLIAIKKDITEIKIAIIRPVARP
jgi:hypothetical protein